MKLTQTSIKRLNHPILAGGIVSGSIALGMLISTLMIQAPNIFAAVAPREQTQRRTILPIADLKSGRTIIDPMQRTSDNRIGVAMQERQVVMTRNIQLSFAFPDARPLDPWIIPFKDHPTWIHVEDAGSTIHSVIDIDLMVSDIARSLTKSFPPATVCTVTSTTTDEEGTIRPVMQKPTCMARSGVVFDQKELKKSLQEAFANDTLAATVRLTDDQARILYTTGSSSTVLTLIATGRSNFGGSDANRIFNVRKALDEKMNNIIVPAGETFSFNKMIGKVFLSKGWRMGLGIFEGGELRPTPGGGVCQSSTTLYRAVLQAGLPLLDYKNHSLFVQYYEQYGVGQDVTIYTGSQDFSFKNDFTTPILIQSETVGFDAYVRIFSVSDGRSVTLSGPYFMKNAPSDLKVNERNVRKNEIVWLRSVRYSDGNIVDDQLVSRYKYLPRGLADLWIAATAKVHEEAKLVAGH